LYGEELGPLVFSKARKIQESLPKEDLWTAVKTFVRPPRGQLEAEKRKIEEVFTARGAVSPKAIPRVEEMELEKLEELREKGLITARLLELAKAG
jgi:hypothetical protein